MLCAAIWGPQAHKIQRFPHDVDGTGLHQVCCQRTLGAGATRPLTGGTIENKGPLRVRLSAGGMRPVPVTSDRSPQRQGRTHLQKEQTAEGLGPPKQSLGPSRARSPSGKAPCPDKVSRSPHPSDNVSPRQSVTIHSSRAQAPAAQRWKRVSLLEISNTRVARLQTALRPPPTSTPDVSGPVGVGPRHSLAGKSPCGTL